MDHRNPAWRREHAAPAIGGTEVPISALYDGIALAGDVER
jgi:hypothetical protein